MCHSSCCWQTGVVDSMWCLGVTLSAVRHARVLGLECLGSTHPSTIIIEMERSLVLLVTHRPDMFAGTSIVLSSRLPDNADYR